MILLDSVNGRVIELEAALPHHFYEVTIAESITQIPAYAEKDDFALVIMPFEWIGLAMADSRYEMGGEVYQSWS